MKSVSNRLADLLLYLLNLWPYSASELYRPSDRRLSVKLVQTSAVWSAWRIPTAVFSAF
jgi:hypothetical protein